MERSALPIVTAVHRLLGLRTDVSAARLALTGSFDLAYCPALLIYNRSIYVEPGLNLPGLVRVAELRIFS